MIRLTRAHAREIERAAERAYPYECCGVLIGTETSGDKVVTDLRRAQNAREDRPERRYAIAPEELLAAEQWARAHGVDVIGYYHSHPDAPPSPSAHDRAHAWPWVSYVIVSVECGRAASMMSWARREVDALLRREPIEIDG